MMQINDSKFEGWVLCWPDGSIANSPADVDGTLTSARVLYYEEDDATEASYHEDLDVAHVAVTVQAIRKGDVNGT